MKTPMMLLQDLESLYGLQKEGGISLDEFKKSKKEIIGSIIKDDALGARDLKFAHTLFGKKVLTQEEYHQIKTAALKIKLPEKSVIKSDKTAFSLAEVLLYLYKLVLFAVSFVVKLFLGIVNFFIFNLVVDGLKKK